MKKLGVLLSLFWLISFFPVRAQNTVTEQVDAFSSVVIIQQNGDIRIKEHIVYNFGPYERHGIYRKINQVRTNKSGEKFKITLSDVTVKDENGGEIPFKLTEEDGEAQIKIGEASKLISGVHIYDISYIEHGALIYFSDHDELYWQVTGTSWEVPIEKVQTEVKVEGMDIEPSAAKATCFTGSESSEASNCTASYDQNTYTFIANNPILAGEGFTIVAGFPKGIAVVEPEKIVDFWTTIWGKATLLGIMVLAFIWYILYPLWLPLKWFLYGRDPSAMKGEATVWYDPPITKERRKLTPAETGALIDEHVGPSEVTALIVDLARRGYMKIVEKGKDDFELKKIVDTVRKDTLQSYEESFMKDIFKSKVTVRIKDADLTSTVESLHKKLYLKLVEEGYFPENPDSIRKFYIGIAAVAGVTFNFLLLITASIFGRIMPRKTIEGVSATKVARSLKNFLNSQDRQLAFQAQNQMFFEKLLPYAIAFGVEKVWAKRFEKISMEQPDWYVSSHPGTFNSVVFSNSLHSSVNVINKSATPTTSSSGFSSGFSGGSVGGGGGGGGGGSW